MAYEREMGLIFRKTATATKANERRMSWMEKEPSSLTTVLSITANEKRIRKTASAIISTKKENIMKVNERTI